MKPLSSPSPGRPGDNGTSSLADGHRLPKHHAAFDALGSLDELGAALGLLRAIAADASCAAQLEAIQRDLLDVGAEMAQGTPRLRPTAAEEIDRAQRALDLPQPPASSFSLPGANELSARAHWARTVCRRAERDLVRLREISPDRATLPALAFLNRLSGLLFSMARAAEHPLPGTC